MLLLVPAYLAMLVAPLRTSWACADGTHCVQDRTRQFVCPGGSCSTGASCCKKKHAVACKHGAFPSIQADSGSAGVESPDHCRFSISAAPKLVAAAETSDFLLSAGDMLPVAPTTAVPLPDFVPTWRTEYSLGYRPPPHLSTGPSRAPPSL
jgi:hypothetical protein